MLEKREVFEILKRKPGSKAKPGEKVGWMAFVKGFGSPNGCRNFWFTEWAKDTFSATREQAKGIYRKSWKDWKLVEVRPVRLVKRILGPTEPEDLDIVIDVEVLMGTLSNAAQRQIEKLEKDPK